MPKKIKRVLALYTFKLIEITKPLKLNQIMLLIDATYWGLNFGVIVFKDAISKKFIWWHFINQKLEDYEMGLVQRTRLHYKSSGK
ncbi:MAG: hypothetical protein SPH77_04325 [Campylobacter sp.]|uniref:hypothetical protein n=1 Tax=Campylobacter sp. TaxID=205 RepID=UPI002A76136F|nr:hypothetical protein [Campylobacter sp.]MCI6177518.1 hypothetical protein [Campylobacter sp.]MDY3246410.1 hypothetical protein [Campylobacter sp.]MDY4013705.1 hypothetical protein [Campylobacter sp.]MDY6188040.1 hypothetical protein [Campylobacter sp.]